MYISDKVICNSMPNTELTKLYPGIFLKDGRLVWTPSENDPPAQPQVYRCNTQYMSNILILVTL